MASERTARSRAGTARVERSRRTGVLLIRFALPRAQRVTLALRGPLPSCGLEAELRLRGRAGANVVRFSRTLGRHRVVPGSYVLSVSVGSRRALRTAVRVSARGAVLLGPEVAEAALAACAARTTAHLAALDRPTAPPLPSVARDAEAAPAAEPPPPRAKVLSFSDIPPVVGRMHPALAVAIGLALLAMFVAGIGGMAAFVRRRVRSA